MAASQVAVFSDVHGNLQGLKAVLDDIRRHGEFDEIVAAGDHCLNGPDPDLALDLVLESASVILYGNTDRDIVSAGETDPDAGDKKQSSIDWTRERLGSARIDLLSRMEFSWETVAADGSVLQVVHANPHDVDRHIFPDRSDDELRELIGPIKARVLVFGHLHIPFVRQLDDLLLVNIAAAGLPRDGDRRATWGAFSWEPDTGWTARIHRVEYDMQATVDRIYASGMPHPDRRAGDLLRASYD